MPKELQLTASDLKALVDDDIYEDLLQYKWYVTKWNCVGRTYRSPRNGKTRHISLPNHIMQTFGILYDHKDRNGLNNLRDNLRVATNQQNSFNRSKRAGCSSKYKGVTYERSRATWRALIKYNGKTIHLGTFQTEIEAAVAYDDKATELFKEYAVLNFNAET